MLNLQMILAEMVLKMQRQLVLMPHPHHVPLDLDAAVDQDHLERQLLQQLMLDLHPDEINHKIYNYMCSIPCLKG